MTSSASVEYALASAGIAFGSKALGYDYKGSKNRKSGSVRAVHDCSPVTTRMSVRPRKQSSRAALSA
jgi:hypothetical protein